MRGWVALPIAFLAALLIALPIVALTETGLERDVKEVAGFDTDDCDPAPNLASPWLEGPPLTEPRDEPRAVTAGGYVYLVGGTLDVENLEDERHRLLATDQMTRFDPRTGRYEELAPLPQALNHIALTSHRGQVYALGGYGTLTDANTRRTFYRYDPETDRWSRLPDLPEGRAAGAAGVIGDRLIYAGGAHDSVARPDTFAFDFESRRWSRLAPMHSRREHVGETVAGGKLYVLGGRTPATLAVDTAERYDPGDDSWERLPPMPVPSGGLAALDVDDRVIAVGGGDDGAGTVTGAVQEFDPAADEWALLADLRVPRHGHGAAAANGRIWAFGGSRCAYFNPTDSVESLPAPAG